MNCEIICIGTELLTGDTLNTNVQYISRKLSRIGYNVLYHTTIGDNPDRVKSCFGIAAKRADVIIITGGLGPTQDDLTKQTIAEYFGMPLKRDEAQVKKLEKRFDRFNYTLTENNYRQCDIPVGAKAIDNTCGTAPGIHIEKDGLSVFMLPGVPSEMKAMFDLYVMPILSNQTDQVVISRYFNICDFGESQIEESILDLVKNQTNPTIATYAKPGEVLIRITADGTDPKQVNALLDDYSKEIEKRFGTHIFAHSQKSLSKTVGEFLMKNGITVASAESCTGGLIASMLTEIPGISDVFKMGLVTYSNEAKRELLGVKNTTLDTYGAVSEETAKEMCEGLARISGCDLNVSVTGIAGPDGGTAEKPVGLVYIGICYKGKTRIVKNRFNGARKRIQLRSAVKAFAMMREAVLGLE